MEVGGRNTDFTAEGQYGAKAGRADIVRKVGTGTMTFKGIQAYRFVAVEGTIAMATNALPYRTDGFVFNGGTFKFDGELFTVDPSAQFAVTDNAAIKIDDGGVDRTFATALPATTGGFVKLGAGNLTLDAAPLYTGATIISNGTLTVQAAFDASNTSIVVDDIAAALAADKAYLTATTITGKPTLVSEDAKASKYRLAKVSVEGGTAIKLVRNQLVIVVR